jgi:hypothetical protein
MVDWDTLGADVADGEDANINHQNIINVTFLYVKTNQRRHNAL